MTISNNRGALEKLVIDPRHGDVETDFSSTKQHSMLSLAGGLLVEISLPKLIMAWTLLLLVPGLLLGLGPIVASDWVRALSGSVGSPLAVVFAVFFFGFLWGMPGAFLGVPIRIAIVTLCAHYSSTSWIATLLSGKSKPHDSK